MDNITFSSDNYNSTSRYAAASADANKSKMVEFMIKKGIVKDEKTGNMVLLVIAIIFFIITAYIIKHNFFPSIPEVELSAEEQMLLDQTGGGPGNNNNIEQ